MAISPANCGAVILAGGQSRRMGRCKALLEFDGEPLLARLVREMSAFDELWISANDPALAQGLPGRLVRDLHPGLGPLAGLQAALCATSREYLFTLPCDLPFFTGEAAAAMLDAFSPGTQAMVCVDSAGRVHPLCGIYARAVLPALDQRIAQGRLRVRDLLEAVPCQRYPIAPRFPDRILENINTPDAYRRAAAGEEGDHP